MAAPDFIHIYLFVVGTVFGSFLNVVIFRFGEKEPSLVPRSRCRKCGKKIFWYENIPIFSYLFLRGKCSECKQSISLQYPIVELISGVAAAILWDGEISPYSFGILAFEFLVFSCFICHFVIDLRHYILPNKINIVLAVAFLGYSLAHHDWIHWAMGGLIGLGFPGLVTWIFYKLRGKIGLGMGDIKLFGALGLYLGPRLILTNIFVSCFLGAVVGGLFILIARKGKDHPIPFGPSIIVVSSLQIFIPDYFNPLIKYLTF